MADDSYLMVYRGMIDEPYNAQVPNKSQGILIYATSPDGLTWTPQGVAIETRTATLEGWADGPELVTWDSGILKLFFWGYRGVYESKVESTTDGVTFEEPKLVYRGANVDPKAMYSPNPPGDPTLGKINGVWTMFYGSHQQGIFRATLKK